MFDSKDNLQAVEGFFKNQVQVFDAAANMVESLQTDLDYLSREPEANAALNQIRLMVAVDGGFSYQKIPQLNGLMATVREGHDRLLESKRNDLNDLIAQCMAAVHQAANGDPKARDLVKKADGYFDQQKQKVQDYQSLALMDGLVPPMLRYKDDAVDSLEVLLAPPKPVTPPKGGDDTPAVPAPKKIIHTYNRSIVFPAKTLQTAQDVDDYVEKMRQQLKELLKSCDGIQLQ